MTTEDACDVPAVPGGAPIRIARPSSDLAAAERFWVGGLGLDVLFRSGAEVEGGHLLLVVGWPDAVWHLELVGSPVAHARAVPTEEDLLVIYLGSEPDPRLIQRLLDHGGRRVTSPNPYWQR